MKAENKKTIQRTWISSEYLEAPESIEIILTDKYQEAIDEAKKLLSPLIRKISLYPDSLIDYGDEFEEYDFGIGANYIEINSFGIYLTIQNKYDSSLQLEYEID